jgi:hypothetical protein
VVCMPTLPALGKIAIALFLTGGLLTVAREFSRYSSTGTLDVGRLALGVAVPGMMYVMIRTALRR